MQVGYSATTLASNFWNIWSTVLKEYTSKMSERVNSVGKKSRWRLTAWVPADPAEKERWEKEMIKNTRVNWDIASKDKTWAVWEKKKKKRL